LQISSATSSSVPVKLSGRIFEAVTAAGLGRHVGDHLGGVGRDLLDAGDVLGKHHAALQFAGGIVEVDDRLVRAFERFEGAGDQLRPALHQHLQGNILRHAALLDAPAGEVEVGLRCGGETDLDFLEAHVEQQLEHAGLAVMAHRVDQRLVAVAQVHRTPDRRLGDHLAGPGAVRRNCERGDVLIHGLRHPPGLFDSSFNCPSMTRISRLIDS
jgi:hypothetical protein